MDTTPSTFVQMKNFLGFGEADHENLRALAPVFEKHGPRITDEFYAILGRYAQTAKLIEGRVDALKATHRRWMMDLFSGDYGDAYFENRLRIGRAHVRIGLDPYYVEGVMTHLRLGGQLAIREEMPDERGRERFLSYVKILDLDLAAINLAYADERIERLQRFTGMSRKLLETCVQRG